MVGSNLWVIENTPQTQSSFITFNIFHLFLYLDMVEEAEICLPMAAPPAEAES